MWLAKFSVKNPILVNFIVLFIIIVGAYSLFTLPRELIPDVPFNWVFIITPYPGVSPEEIEKLVTIPIEDEIADVDKIESISSESSEGVSFISVKFEEVSNGEFDKLVQDLKSEVDKVRDLPADVEDPEILEFSMNEFIPILNVVLSGDLPELEMKRIAENLRDEILDIKNVSKAELGGIREREILVNVDPARLNAYNLAISQIIQTLKKRNMNMPGGTLKLGRSEYLLRTMVELHSVDEIKNTIIRSGKFGDYLKVKDVADVKDTFKDLNIISRLDKKTAITISISKKKEGNSIKIINEIKKIVEKYNETIPEGVKITLTNDSSIYIKDSLNVLQSNAIIGLILVIIVLYFFLGWRNALFAALGIPVTFMATFFFMKQTGQSLNGNSLFGLVLILGVIVDDAIIIIENCYRYIQKGISPRKAAIIGTTEVIKPVLSATGTTIAAFLPLVLMPGIMGKFMEIIPIVVSLCLLASIFEAFVVLPAHIGDWSKKGSSKNNHRKKYFQKFAIKYVHLLKKFLKRRYYVLVSIIIIFLLSISLIPLVGVEMFSEEEVSQFFILVELPEKTKLEETDRVIKEVEKVALTLPEEEVKSVIANAGLMQTETEWLQRSYVGQVIVDLVEKKDRKRTIDEIMNSLREKVNNISGIKSVRFMKIQTGPPVGKPVEVKVKGKYFDELQKVVDEVKNRLKQMDGVYDINQDFGEGKSELKIYVDEEKASMLGLDVFQIAYMVRNAFEGNKATVIRDGDEEIDVVVKFKKSARKELSDLKNMKLITPKGNLIALKDVAKIKVEPGFYAIKRFNRKRAITISANIDKRKTSAVKVNNKLVEEFKDIGKRYPGYRLDFRGEFEEFKKSFSSLGRLFIIGVILIFMILGGQFKSLIQPFIILFTIPFAFIGAMLGLLLSRSPFSIVTLFGVVALAGIVVNDSIVLISFINNRRRSGYRRWRSIIEAGKVRLRPIILTSVTTIFGLLPMAIGLGGRSEGWAPFATTIVGGLLVSTIATLFAIPCIFSIVDDIKLKFLKDKFITPEGKFIDYEKELEDL
ncbi:hypothetical protein DRQ09_04865 [candidate division KSB1 bacterium]|nr:MAG: hypothetical protein DRQ09_04865 [candidate division KSB1 bacterium]